MRILVIEDERKVASALEEGLTNAGYQVDVACSGEDGFYLLSTRRYDLLLLDLMLPGRDGLEILKTIRRKGMQFPILILTARDTVEDRVNGLDSGADDYLVKPFAFAELLARIRVLLRRGRSESSLRLVLADLEMDLVTRKVLRGKSEINLTVREFDLLEYLLRHQGQIVSREMLARDVWQQTNRATPIDNLIDVHIARLRRKIDDPFPVKLIHTIRGVGFMMNEGAP
ncbi:two component transcriptional regulator, winged helix family [Caldithrix abyssi DSM 13497]|uniref:Heavy metal response regulator n=1 Tax=Caldithrix abyssi DSM 13497 TaxID=880073 RepID=H1XYA6_CALAY|nr:response regulator [Caldithrix abyssi]APF19267.1 heavy metal response regulator [Caldithrix abyssi DSM 13497]EHO43173.1 two component transcriptional regulator, winged helix family [Caldithrix abyssi DSM 13497]